MTNRDNTSRLAGARYPQATELAKGEDPSELLRELVAHLRQNRTQLREEWVAHLGDAAAHSDD
jgi:uncharacterized protein CbrC (UPF0167 family)